MIEIHEVRRARLGELAELCRAHAEYDRRFEPAIAPLPDDLAERLDRLLFTEKSLICLVAEEEGELLGYVSGFATPSTWRGDIYYTMDCLYIAENHRGARLGTRLVDAMREAAESAHAGRLRWQTPLDNDRSKGFYARYGAGNGLGHADKRTYVLPL
ncbi:GNAT family N-acetyltransferase [Sciscionella sediminilitoris]|uniref:GNAT family N-acetyltransferase n=1 Tax=Sciscionella sediminilitoris TaxID=1445613 RepID=UPI00056B4BE8|nr:GNAT family N-acetyltransferase [Sciscionella sp. SE31]